MNRTSRTNEPIKSDGLNQNPDAFSNDLVTNQDMNGIANARRLRRSSSSRSIDDSGQPTAAESDAPDIDPDRDRRDAPGQGLHSAKTCSAIGPSHDTTGNAPTPQHHRHEQRSPLQKLLHTLATFGKFVGPGFLVAVAYIDPGNYATDISAGAEYRFRLLFIILISNIFAVFLQCLSVKLGTVTGLNLAEACRAFLPRWLNYFLYVMAEVAIIATDIAEVIGTAIGLNLLIPQLPLVAGCALSILDVMLILLFYRPNGSMKGLRLFEFFVMLLVMAVVICFCIQLSLISDTTPGEVFHGYVPNDSITQSGGLYQACGILGATVMPHSLFLGSGIVQSRLKDYDTKHGLLPSASSPSDLDSVDEGKTGTKTFYIPSLAAIRHSLKYSYAEVTLSLVTFALFVNSAILVVAGASLYENPAAQDVDIFGIHALLRDSISPAAATIFALALLFSGVSAGIVCTIAGQMVCEGALRWRVRPWLRRLLTRSVSVAPSIVIAAGAGGREKLNRALTASQVVLSVVLPFVAAPLILFTCRARYMTARTGNARLVTEGEGEGEGTNHETFGLRGNATAGDEGDTAAGIIRMPNAWWVAGLAIVVWLVIVVLNVANLVLLGLGDG